MTMKADGTIDWAQVKLLGPETEPKIGTPRVLIYHTMVGNLAGTDAYFRQQGYQGDESTWGVGGMWEPGNLDGALWQWQYAGYQADAQYAGNDYADSVETADGGNPNHPWTTAQLITLINLTVDWCRWAKAPAQLITKETDRGLGYHSMFHDWNLSGHTCPGEVRIGQLRQVVIPKARSILAGEKWPPPPPPPGTAPKYWVNPHPKSGLMIHIATDGIWGKLTIEATQLVTGVMHLDGIWGPGSRRNLQNYLGVKPDAIIGPVTVKAWKRHLKKKGFWPWPWHTIDGTWNKVLTVQHQKALNAPNGF